MLCHRPGERPWGRGPGRPGLAWWNSAMSEGSMISTPRTQHLSSGPNPSQSTASHRLLHLTCRSPANGNQGDHLMHQGPRGAREQLAYMEELAYTTSSFDDDPNLSSSTLTEHTGTVKPCFSASAIKPYGDPRYSGGMSLRDGMSGLSIMVECKGPWKTEEEQLTDRELTVLKSQFM